MKIIKLEIAGKTYMSGKITTYLTKQALRLQKDALEYATTAMKAMDRTNIEAASKLTDELMELQDRKVWVLCEAFGNQFTVDDVEKNLDQEEVDSVINQIIGAVGATIEKN